MRERKTMSTLAIIAAVLLLSVAYAAITNITLNIAGNIYITPEQAANFKVAFTGTPTYSGNGTGDVQITGETSGIMNISGLSEVGQKGTATFTVQNSSSDNLTAYLSATTTTGNNASQYISVDHSFGTTTLTSGNTTTLNIVVKVLSVPETDTIVTIGVDITASPEETTGNTITGGNTIIGGTSEICANAYINSGEYIDDEYHKVNYSCDCCMGSWSVTEAHNWGYYEMYSNSDGTHGGSRACTVSYCGAGESDYVEECYDHDADGYCDYDQCQYCFPTN